MPAADPHWHAESAAAVCRQLGCDPQRGLAGADAATRLADYGPNQLEEKTGRSPWRMLLDQFTDFMILVLLVAAVISGLVGDIEDTLAIIVIIVLNAVIGFVQEFRAERAMAALKRMAESGARVVRDGRTMQLNASALVPGDLILLEAGNVIPADLRLVHSAQLRIDESALTGESVATEKQTHPLPEETQSLGDRTCMAYKGTIVSHGRGSGVVVATGMRTELGRIAALLNASPELRTPMQIRLARLGQRLAIAALVICVLVFVTGILRGEPLLLMFMTAVSLAVAAIPSALPAVVTISLALGAHKMVRQNALIRRLPAVETLGSVSYICSDKTGTLTQNRMQVSTLFADGRAATPGALPENSPWQTLLSAMALCNDARIDAAENLLGDPTETALLLTARQAGYDRTELEQPQPRVRELPFDSERKRMTTFHATPEGFIAYSKGSPETLLPQCERQLLATGEHPIDRHALLHEAEQMAAAGLRVLAFACRHWPKLPAESDAAKCEQNLVFLGFAGLMDPPRPEVKEAVALCRSAGITPVMITGDHPATARAIARELGILEDGTHSHVLTGQALASLNDERLAAEVTQTRVYARVDPAQKIRIVQALQARGEIVAMTGDGVNDAPALKAADIGVAMGKGGTDVAREAAHMVLLDDNFATIVYAVRQGRRLYDNIRKFIRYGITTNSAEIWTIFLAPFLGLPIPLLPIQILWVNLVTDGLPGLALTAEPAERGIMQRRPRPLRESLFAHGMWQHMIWVGLLMGGVCLLIQAWAMQMGTTHWQTMVFTVLTLSQLAHVLAIRSETESLFRIGLFSNRWLLAAVIVTFLLQLMAIYHPFFNEIFRTEALSAGELLLCLLLSGIVFVAVELEKWLTRRGLIYRRESI
ncbi:MAG: calcium-translocating P-type ATPase, PMCA-type [Gallionella sp.]|nr:calcium-translocating P-type ATPase, PMCA-type [Gallionella sp.]